MNFNTKETYQPGKTAVIGVAVALALGLSGCNSNDTSTEKTSTPTEDTSFTPFERVATLAVVTDAAGNVDYTATYSKTQAVAKAIHNFIEENDESQAAYGGYPANWIIAGQETFDADPTTAEGILQIPSLETIVPGDSTSGAYKVQVMDICNSYYAKKALGVSDITTGQTVANGYIHATALPCEVSVYNDGDAIYVDMLNPEAIFTLFFSDTVYGTQMDDEAFATEISTLPSAVKNELKTIIYAALDTADYAYTALSQKSGPVYKGYDAATGTNDILDVVDNSPYDSPYLHYAYMKKDASAFSMAEVTQVAQRIIDTMSINGATVEGRANGVHEAQLESLLSDGSSWRSARPESLGLPGSGGFKNLVIEACSPKYAKQALGTGRHHAPALPCEIGVTAIESSTGSGVYDTLVVSFLEPGFMFTALFSDAFAGMSADELAAYEALPPTVLQDLQSIVNYAIFSDLVDDASPINLIPVGRLTYDMMPG